MNNSIYYYNLTVHEDDLKHFWSNLFSKNNYFEMDLSDINFDLKYASLLNDPMFKDDNFKSEERNNSLENDDKFKL